MDILIPLLACLALGAPIGLAGSVLIGRGPELMSGLFRPSFALGWPHGVQEEDPPGGWTWRMPDAQESSLIRRDADDRAPHGAASWTAQRRDPQPEIVDDPADLEPVADAKLLPLTTHVHAGSVRGRSSW